jgi:hypothetical protein
MMAQAFDAEITHWPTIAAFAAHLQGVPRPSWCLGITNHNSYQPDERNWAGMKSMTSMVTYYRVTKKWSAGPHLFLAAAAPNARHTGIFQMTPLSHVGIHAGDCNDTHLGIEWVGDFDRAPPSKDQYTLGITVNLLILQHWGIPPEAVNVHNECMAGRTCPGKYLTGTQIRASLRTPPPPITKRYRVKHRYVTQRKEDNGPPHVRELVSGEVVVVDKWYANNRVHFADGSGFADLSDLEAA